MKEETQTVLRFWRTSDNGLMSINIVTVPINGSVKEQLATVGGAFVSKEYYMVVLTRTCMDHTTVSLDDVSANVYGLIGRSLSQI